MDVREEGLAPTVLCCTVWVDLHLPMAIHDLPSEAESGWAMAPPLRRANDLGLSFVLASRSSVA